MASRTCPRCGSKRVVPVVYGRPSAMGKLKSLLGRLQLGGCAVSDERPRFFCKRCKDGWEEETVIRYDNREA